MKHVVLYRFDYLGPEILGHLFVLEKNPRGGSRLVFECKTLELKWANNKNNISAFPAGYYNLVLEYSNKFKMDLWELKGVPGRSEGKIHWGSFYRDYQGCIGVGDLHTNFDSDGYPDLRNSKTTLERFHKAMGSQKVSTIHIIGKS